MGFLSDLGKYLGHAAVDGFSSMIPFKKGGKVGRPRKPKMKKGGKVGRPRKMKK
jgi:hypothetical protein